MKENDLKETFDKINMPDEKKNELANRIITKTATLPAKNSRYRSRGKQAAILVTSLILVYAVVFSAMPLLDYNANESFINESKNTSSNDAAAMHNDSFESENTISNDFISKDDISEDAVEQSEVISTVEQSDVSSDESITNSEPEQEDWLTLFDMQQSAKFNQPSTYVITSTEQLEKIGQYTVDFLLSGSFLDADLSVYDDAYFESNFLIITYFQSGYAHYRYEVNPVLTEYETEDIILSVVQTYFGEPNCDYCCVCGFNCFITEWSGEYTGQLIRYEDSTIDNNESLPEVSDESETPISLDIYYGLSAFKGIEVYVWENDGTVFCGIMDGTNRLKSTDEIENLKNHPATLEQMKAILKTYDIPKDYIQIASNTSSQSNDDIYTALDIR